MAEIIWPKEVVEAYERDPEIAAARQALNEWFAKRMLEASPLLRALAEPDDEAT